MWRRRTHPQHLAPKPIRTSLFNLLWGGLGRLSSSPVYPPKARTSAACCQIGKLRIDPMATLPFCGHNMAGYFNHWLQIGTKTESSGSKLVPCLRSG
ncbi:MAG: phosphoenolpyruvate carboxykinase (GTP) [Actinobacteria bacterium]|nr:phosphoenolpyruvate carboxykinase (GTP) [Actinomycetota bacterium]